jgi:putative ATP-dependent endonuclease of OLD family
MSIIPAEAFFSHGVLLVEGPSEEILYKEMLFKNEIDIDYYNLSIFSVGGIQFNVFAKVLQALEIPFAFRTDNDVSTTTIKSIKYWQYLGVNRCLGILNKNKWEHSNIEITRTDILTDPRWTEFEKTINSHGIYMSKVDLENDLVSLIESNILEALKKESAQEAIDYLQGKKALRMQKLVAQLDQDGFEKIYESDFGEPIKYLLERLMHKSQLESELASSDVAEEVIV